MYTVQVFNKIDDLGKASLDSISDDPFFTYGWFKTLEKQTDMPFHPFYIGVYQDNKLSAFAPCFLDIRGEYFIHGLYYFPFMKEILQLGSKIGLWKKQLLICYSPFCFRSKIIAKDKKASEEMSRIVCNKIQELCKKEHILFSSFPFVSELDNLLLVSLKDAGYLQHLWKKTYFLDVRWADFEGYLAHLNYKVRKNVRREIRKCAENGIVIDEETNFDVQSERLSYMSSSLFGKYNRGQRSFLGETFFSSLGENAKDNERLFVAKKRGKVVGFLVTMRKGEVLDCFTCGFDYGLLSNTDFAYFCLVYYFPIEWAIREGIRKIYYRTSADKVKSSRGCSQDKTYSNVKCNNKWLNIFFTVYARLRHSNSFFEV
jgi:predicted N-acyltransferase